LAADPGRYSDPLPEYLVNGAAIRPAGTGAVCKGDGGDPGRLLCCVPVADILAAVHVVALSRISNERGLPLGGKGLLRQRASISRFARVEPGWMAPEWRPNEREGGALSRGLAGPAAATGGRRLFSLPDGLDIRRHRLFQPFEPWQRRLRPRFSFELALAAEHKTCCILETYSSAHNLSLQLIRKSATTRPVLFRHLGSKTQGGAREKERHNHAGGCNARVHAWQASLGLTGTRLQMRNGIQPPKRRCLRLAEFDGARRAAALRAFPF
jgi:hypothetical protein